MIELPTAPAAARNREPILSILREWLPATGLVLEVASGTGEHAVWFSAALPGITWQPTERDPERLEVIAARQEAEGSPNLLAPLPLDAADPARWPVEHADAVLSINMIHIAPWSATQGLMAGAARVLPPGGPLLLYGPFRIDGAHTAPSNAEFDASLRERDPAWGVRDLEAVAAEAARCGLTRIADIPMPANNRTVVFRQG